MDDMLSLVTGYYNAVARILLPIIAVLLLFSCIRALFRKKGRPSPLAVLVMGDGTRHPVISHESAIGRSRLCDVSVPLPTVSRRHAVLTLDKAGWRISDTRSKGGLFVNGEPVRKPMPLSYGDTISLADVPLRFIRPQKEDRSAARPANTDGCGGTMIAAPFLLTFFQLLAFLSLLLHYAQDLPVSMPVCFGGLILAEWILFAVRRFRGIGIEVLAFFLTTLGLCVAASSVPSSLPKQFAAVLLGMAMFLSLEWLLGDITRTMKMRYVIGGLAVGLLALNLLIGKNINGGSSMAARVDGRRIR